MQENDGPISSSRQAFAARPDILVFDAMPDGHRQSCVKLFADITGGLSSISPVRGSRRRLLSVPHLLLTTFETDPAGFLPILLLRALLGRRTAVIFMRAHLRRVGGLHRTLHRLFVRVVNRLRSILPLTLVPLPAAKGGDRFIHIPDPEFWDLGPSDIETPDTALSQRVRDFAGTRQILLVTGYIEQPKGTDFLRDIYRSKDAPIGQLVPVLCGMIDPNARSAAAELAEAGALVVDRYLSRDEMMSLYRAADAAWCCYVPQRDMSSGIFGRAMQFGVAPIVRRGSVLEEFSAEAGNVVAIDWGDADAASLTLRSAIAKSPPRIDHSRATRASMRTLLLNHFGPAAAGAN